MRAVEVVHQAEHARREAPPQLRAAQQLHVQLELLARRERTRHQVEVAVIIAVVATVLVVISVVPTSEAAATTITACC